MGNAVTWATKLKTFLDLFENIYIYIFDKKTIILFTGKNYLLLLVRNKLISSNEKMSYGFPEKLFLQSTSCQICFAGI